MTHAKIKIQENPLAKISLTPTSQVRGESVIKNVPVIPNNAMTSTLVRGINTLFPF